MFEFFSGNKKVAQKLYQQNLELTVKNRALSLLEKLYQTSIETLSPKEEAKEITDTIRAELNLEFTAILIFKEESDCLEPLVFSKSNRLTNALEKLGFLFSDINITDVSKRDLFHKVIYDKTENMTSDLGEIWKELITLGHIKEIKKESNIKTVLLFPLIIDRKLLGVLMLGFNRDYQVLSAVEKTLIKSFINVIALLLDKAYLYNDLQNSYEETKRAYALEKKAKEDLENLDKTKNQFLLTIQHHLRTPLTSMMGYSDLLENGAFGKQSKKTLEVIKKFQSSTQSLIKMVNDFLDITQFQLGKNIISMKPDVDLSLILDEIVEYLKFGAEKKGISLILEKPKKAIIINADREKLKAALSNIFDNAVKYTVQGGVSIKVENNDLIRITVSDTGIGIPPEKIKNLFDKPFERGDVAKKTFATGSGIGLYLASQIIKSHNGKIWAESKGEEQGSVFHIELPIE